VTEGCLELPGIGEADVLLDPLNESSAGMLQPFKRSALVDTKPGLVQIWISQGQMDLARHGV
jgi:hypothetical protein